MTPDALWPALSDALAAVLADPIWPVAAATVFVAGFVKGMAGFGSALVMMPVLSALVGPPAAVAILQLVDGPLAWAMVPGALRKCQLKPVLLLAGGAALGMPLGILVLKAADPEILRFAIAGVVLVMAALLASGWRYRGRPTARLSAGTGLLAGVMGGSTGIGGPPVVLFWLGSQADGASVRANLAVYFATGTIIGLTTLIAAGLVTRTVLLQAATLAPLFALGMAMGAGVFAHLSDGGFRRAALALVAASGVTGLMM
ncbi:MAG: sulfite exporter TauE/SafE family protein [Alphaproteobacteria bacterium]|nr:sulfite exporter TauE/SafE family protein [Alphaproteobacteria bacterium]